MKNIKLKIVYYFPFLTVLLCYAIIYSIKLILTEKVNNDPIDIVETAKQYVLIMGSLAGFSLLIMGFILFEISSSKLKIIDIELHEKEYNVRK
jgi:hypothetical protein